MGRMNELHAAEVEAMDLSDDHAYDLYLAETALDQIASGISDPKAVANRTLGMIRRGSKPERFPPRVINGHVLHNNQTCRCLHDGQRNCPVCIGGLNVCSICGTYEAGLDNPCKGGQEVDF